MLMTPSHVPSTPTKPRNDHVNSYVDSLAVRWGLPLRGRDKNWSPSKKEITIEEEIIGSLKFLYYKDPSFLSNVIAEFDKHVFSWLNKLHSDAALPGVSYNKASAHLQVGSPENVGRITEELCQTLNRARSFFIQQHGLATNVNRDALHLSTSLSAFANRVSSMPSVSRKDAAISLPNTGLPQHASKAKGSRPVQSSKGSFSECFTELQTLWDVSDSQPKGSTNDPAFHGFSRFSNSYPNPIPQGSQRQPSVSKPLEHSQPQKLREAFLSRDGNEKLQAGVSLSTISLEGIKNDSQTQWGPGTVTSSEIEYVPIASHLGPKDKINIKKRSLAAEHSSSMPRKSPKGSHLNDTPFFHKVKTSTTAPKSTPYTHKNQYSDLKDSWRQKVNANDSFSTTSSFGEAMTSDISMSRVSAHPPEFTESFSSVQGKIIEESSPGIGGKEVIDLESEEFDMLDVIESMQVLFQMPFPLSLGILTRKVETSRSSPSQLSSSLRDVSIDSRDVATDKPRTEKVDGVPEMDVPIPSIEPGATLSLAENELLLYLDRHLMKSGPFAHDLPPNLCALPFRERYEIYRVARKCGTPLNKLEMPFSTCRNNQKLLWRWLHKHVSVHEDMPEPTPARVWKDAGDEFQNVSLAGDLAFNNTKGGPLFRFQLKALKSEDSNRIGRRFGGDRLLVLGIPSLDKRSLPSFLRPQADQVRHLITAWLVVQPHRIIGRTWKAFYVKKKSDNKKKKAKNLQTAQESQNEVQSLVYLFAVDGKGFRRPEYSLGTANTSSLPKKHEHTDMHTAMSVENLLRWLIDLDINKNMTAHKAFSRIALGVSKTQPTITFEPLQIRRIPDIWSPKTLDSEGKKSISEVMNDGCARISRRAAYEIAERLGIENHIPSAFQGRIAGAKGLWMVDCSYRETHTDKADEEFWIEITDSQSKFETHPIDEISPDDDRVTFEVNGVSSPLSSASLNFQLLPILEDRGVPRTVIADLLKEDLNFHVTELKAAMHSPLTFRKWSSDNRSTNSERAKNAGITWDASVPQHDTEKINWLLESGFHPQSCHFLKEIIWKVTKEFCMSLEERLHIGVGQSTYVYCVADPLGVLEEGEIHFGFSTTFKDPKSGFQETILHDVDALVARLPAHLQSDIQRVRCVFRPELRALKDVVVFSTKGQRPLAQYLSGGDYDGDKVFCCWDQRIVQPFQNASLPAKTPSIKDLGITQDSTTLADIDISRTVTQFLHRSFHFVMQPRLLGWCTRFQEDMCYARNSINHPGAVTVATLLGLLVDSEKQGYTFTEADWNKLKFTNPHIYPKNPKVPAYRPGSNQKPTNHIIDYLKFSIARDVREDALRDLNERFKKVPSCDFDLVALYKREEADAMSSPQLQAVLRKLNDDIQGVYNHWRTRVSVAEERRAEEGHFTSALGATYTRFLAILPPSDSSHEVVKRWWREEDPVNTTTYSTSSFTSFASFTSTSTAATSFTSTTTAREEEETVEDANQFSHWKLLRASAAFAKFHNTKFVWYVAGRQLGFLKARIGRKPVMLRGDMHAALKVDGGYVRKVGRREEEEG